MKKRYFFPIISILFLLFVAGCSKETEADIPTPEPTPEQPEEPDVKPDRILSDDMILAEEFCLQNQSLGNPFQSSRLFPFQVVSISLPVRTIDLMGLEL